MSDTVLILAVGAAVLLLAVVVVVFYRRKASDAPATVVEEAAKPAGFGLNLRRIWSRGLDDEAWLQLEEALLAADVGVEPTTRIVESVRSESPQTVDAARGLVIEAVLTEFSDQDRVIGITGDPAVVMVVGVNGAGKTTSVAKLANRLKAEGRSVLLAAADTFRAAGGEQLGVWGQRIDVPVVSGQEGGDSAAVVHDALSSARAKGSEVVIVDTAGRLHANKNLMAELSKVHRVAGGESGVGEVLLVLDASAGQNGLNQVREFASAVPLTGVILAKFDGTARGGIVVAVESTLGVPVKLVGTGESVEDIEPFDPAQFVPSLID